MFLSADVLSDFPLHLLKHFGRITFKVSTHVCLENTILLGSVPELVFNLFLKLIGIGENVIGGNGVFNYIM